MSMPKTLTVCGIRLRLTAVHSGTEFIYQCGALYGAVRFIVAPLVTSAHYIEFHSHGQMMLVAEGKTWRKALSNLNLLRFSMLDKAADDLSTHQRARAAPAHRVPASVSPSRCET